MIDVHVCNENPLCSLSYDAPVAQFFIDVLDLRRFVINSGAYGGPSLKDLEMRTSLPRKTTRRFFARTKKDAIARFKKNGVKPTSLMVKAKKWKNGKRQQMADSAAYPEELAEMIVQAAVYGVEEHKRWVEQRKAALKPVKTEEKQFRQNLKKGRECRNTVIVLD